jgi:small subunit ribosomal protein S20
MQPKISALDASPNYSGQPAVIDNQTEAANNTPLFGPGETAAESLQDGIIAVANIKSARKRARQADKARLHNMGLRSRMRTHIKAVIVAVEKGDKDAAVAAYKAAVPVIDSMINKGIVNKNKAARHKSRLNKMIKALAA